MLVMDTNMQKSTFLSLMLTLIITLATATFSDQSEKILLSDVKVLTLHHGQMTNARRSPAVPQVKCVGGSAHYKFTPKVVQCVNKGSDGFDIQWECKTDMDNAYRFGQVEVSCEGYDYPNDPYILKGSCGLEYTLEFTEEGLQRGKQEGGYSYYSSHYYNGSTEGVDGIVVFVIVLFLIYVVYKVCIAPAVNASAKYRREHPSRYGFRQDTPSPPSYDSCGTQGFAHTSYTSASTGGTGGSFWTGAATGGLLGYMLGRGNDYNYGPAYRTRSSWFGQNYGHSGGSTGSFFSSPSSGGSSGTRTASGFGGTSRR